MECVYSTYIIQFIINSKPLVSKSTRCVRCYPSHTYVPHQSDSSSRSKSPIAMFGWMHIQSSQRGERPTAHRAHTEWVTSVTDATTLTCLSICVFHVGGLRSVTLMVTPDTRPLFKSHTSHTDTPTGFIHKASPAARSLGLTICTDFCRYSRYTIPISTFQLHFFNFTFLSPIWSLPNTLYLWEFLPIF